jgi:hypothetical protein
LPADDGVTTGVAAPTNSVTVLLLVPVSTQTFPLASTSMLTALLKFGHTELGQRNPGAAELLALAKLRPAPEALNSVIAAGTAEFPFELAVVINHMCPDPSIAIGTFVGGIDSESFFPTPPKLVVPPPARSS